MRRWRLIPLVGLYLAFGGCGGQTLVYNGFVSSTYSPTEFGVGAGRRDLTTVIRGDPFGGGQEQFDVAFLKLLNRVGGVPQPTHFTDAPGESARPAYRVVFLFDAAPPVTPFRLCSSPPHVAQTEPGPEVRVVAAFCRNQGPLTKVQGEVGGVTSIDDPKFRSLIGQILTALFPRFDPTQGDDRERLIIADRP